VEENSGKDALADPGEKGVDGAVDTHSA
jgi:hypothetical protein